MKWEELENVFIEALKMTGPKSSGWIELKTAPSLLFLGRENIVANNDLVILPIPANLQALDTHEVWSRHHLNGVH